VRQPQGDLLAAEAKPRELTMNLTRTSLAVSVVTALILPVCSSAAEQGTKPDAAAAAKSATRANAKWKHPRTPWGDPDLQGMWPVVHLISVPLERPPQYGDRLHFTPEELAEQQKRIDARNKRYQDEDSADRIGQGHWAEVTEMPPQTSLIVDPPNGRLPPLTDQGKQQSAKMGSSWNHKVFDSVADFDVWDRCVTRGMPASMFPFQYNNGIQILQTPGYVVINMEMIHEARIVPVGKVAALDGEVKQWLGSSRGHWEGNTLVVETTNFNGQASMTSFGSPGAPIDPRATSTQLKIVERFERTGADDITYTVTTTDPVTQSAPWTAQLPWKRDDSYQMFEYACHEDNEAIRNYITASRASRAQEAAKK
jgi:hypothetical protein